VSTDSRCSIYAGLRNGGTLGLFAGLNLVAFVLVFLLVEETKRRSLEDLDSIFAVKESRFTRYQVMQYLPWFFQYYVLGRAIPRPELYIDLIWGNHGKPASDNHADTVDTRGDEPNGDITTDGKSAFAPSSPFGGHRDPESRRRDSEDEDYW
jgi:hypothetical protein